MARNTRRRTTADETENEAVEGAAVVDTDTTDTKAPAQSEGQSEEPPVTTETAEPQVETPDAEPETAPDAAPAAEAAPEGGAPADGAAAPAEAEAPKTDPAADLMSVSEGLVAERDPQTGTLSVAQVGTFGEQYRALEAGAKRSVRASITTKIQELLDDGDPETLLASMMAAKAFNELLSETKRSAPAKAAAPKADPTEAYVESYMAIALAGMAIPLPDEVNKEKATEAINNLVGAYQNPESDEHKAFSTYLDWSRAENKEERGEEPKVPEYVKKAVKIAEGKAAGRATRGAAKASKGDGGGVRSGSNGNIGKHVEEAMAGYDVDQFVSIADICKVVTSEYGGPKSKPSPGAVTARLFPKSGGKTTLEGIEGVSAEDSPVGKKGAKRTA